MSARKRWLAAFTGALVLAAIGCGHTDTNFFLLRAPASSRSSAVIYLADQPGPTRPYSEIAIVQAVGFGSDATAEDVTQALTDKAARLGCDAVARVFIDIGYSRAHAAGVCVRYTDSR